MPPVKQLDRAWGRSEVKQEARAGPGCGGNVVRGGGKRPHLEGGKSDIGRKTALRKSWPFRMHKEGVSGNQRRCTRA